MLFLLAMFLGCTKDDTTGDTDSETDVVNQAPVAVDDSAETMAGQPVEIDVLDNDDDPDGDDIEIVEVTQAEHGLVEIDGDEIVYTPLDGEFVGVDSFTYGINDGRGGTDQGSVTVLVTEPPTLVLLTPEDGSTVTGTEVTLTFAVTGCNFTSPGVDQYGCHAHKWLDDATWSEADGTGHGIYAVEPYTISGLEPGEHAFTLKLAVNDGTDGLWSPAIEDTITLTIAAP